MGFYSGPSYMKKYMLCFCIPQVLFIAFCGYAYYQWNGGEVREYVTNVLTIVTVTGELQPKSANFV